MPWDLPIGKKTYLSASSFPYYELLLQYRQVHQRSCQLVKSLLKNSSPIQVAQYLSHVSETDTDKIRIAALKILAELMEEYCHDPEILTHVVKK